ncbi:hypothetical protein A9R05_21855 [Burkholderia sp. KK1]|nr:hypothetical protein A9R05_21855 [Burkholderia sp. KK1]
MPSCAARNETASGTAATAKTLLEVTIVAGLLAEQGVGKVSVTTARAAEIAIKRAVEVGLSTGRSSFEEEHVPAMCRIVAAFERQLEAASTEHIEAAFTAASRLGVA